MHKHFEVPAKLRSQLSPSGITFLACLALPLKNLKLDFKFLDIFASIKYKNCQEKRRVFLTGRDGNYTTNSRLDGRKEGALPGARLAPPAPSEVSRYS